MHFVISHTPDSKHYYVEQIGENLYMGYQILDYVSGVGSFQTLDENNTIEITGEMLEERIIVKNRKQFKWLIVGKVVSMKDSNIKLIV